ncbi:MAG: hypothetical protein Q9227_002611 [Pyrenula ochraceoflavens]
MPELSISGYDAFNIGAADHDMIPPIDPAILSANPAFAKLHEHLTTQLLSPDAQTAATATSTARDEALATLQRCHLQLARKSILIDSLNAIACDGDNGLDAAAKERCLLAAALIQRGSLSENETNLLREDLQQLRTELEEPSSKAVMLLSKYLNDQHKALLQVVTSRPTKSTSALNVHTATLSAKIRELASSVQHQSQIILPTRQAFLTNSTASLARLYQQLLSLQIQHLERYTHGMGARSTKSQAEYLSTVSAGMAAKAKILLFQTRQDIYTGEVQEALESYAEHLNLIEERLTERETQLAEELKTYQQQGETRMRECGRRYKSVTKEIEELKAEIERLGNG